MNLKGLRQTLPLLTVLYLLILGTSGDKAGLESAHAHSSVNERLSGAAIVGGLEECLWGRAVGLCLGRGGSA